VHFASGRNLRAVKLRLPAHVSRVSFGIAQIRLGEITTGEIGISKIASAQIRSAEISVSEFAAEKNSAPKIRIWQGSAAKISIHQIRAAQIEREKWTIVVHLDAVDNLVGPAMSDVNGSHCPPAILCAHFFLCSGVVALSRTIRQNVAAGSPSPDASLAASICASSASLSGMVIRRIRCSLFAFFGRPFFFRGINNPSQEIL
jgi:hypothetical protein